MKRAITAETLKRAKRVINSPRDVSSAALLAATAALEKVSGTLHDAQHDAIANGYLALERVADMAFKEEELQMHFPHEHPATPHLMRAMAFLMGHHWSSAQTCFEEAVAACQRKTDPCRTQDPVFGDLMRFAGRIERFQMGQRQKVERRIELADFKADLGLRIVSERQGKAA